VIEFGFDDSGKIAYFAVQIENEGKKGPWGPLVQALIPSGVKWSFCKAKTPKRFAKQMASNSFAVSPALAVIIAALFTSAE
jgi:hypothetical protein